MTLIETLRIIRAQPDPPNEEAAKFQILVPILQSLGWNLARQELVFEYRVGAGRIVIALLGPDRVVSFIEAKAPRVDLNKHVEQVVRYAFHEGVDICVLTNGPEWWMYLPMRSVPFEKRRFEMLNIRNDPVADLERDFEGFMSKENLLSGKALESAEQRWQEHQDRFRLRTAVPKVWSEMRTNPDRALVDLVRERVYEGVGLRPSADRVERTILPSTPSAPEPPPPLPKPNGPPPVDPPNTRPIRFKLWNETYRVSSWIRLLLTVLEELHKRHGDSDFAQRLGRIVSYGPDKFARPVQVGATGFYINRSIPITEIQRRSYDCLALFSHPRSDLEILSD